MKATNTTAAAPAPRATTPAQILAKSAGLSIKQVCKRAGIGERHFANLARNGQAGAYRAEILGHVCKCPDRVFLWGYETYLRHEAARARAGEAHSQPEVMTAGQSTVAAHRPRCYQRPTLRKI